MELRKIDRQRRIVIPKNIFDKLGLSMWQEVEVTIEYGTVCIRKFEHKNIQERKYIGVVRNLDEINRIVIPAEYLNVLGIKVLTNVSITLENDTIKLITI